MAPVILWFRRNLRLRDNAALNAAAASGSAIIPVYIVDETDHGGASRWWLHHSLTALDNDLRERGAALRLFSGNASKVLTELAVDSGASAIYYARRFEPAARQQEIDLQDLAPAGVDIHDFDDGNLNGHGSVMTKAETPFRVFTPYWRRASERSDPPAPEAIPEAIKFASNDVRSDSISDLGLLPAAPNWAEKFEKIWIPGEEGALRRLDSIESAASDYATQRDRPDLDTTSRLSPHLHFGEVSPRQAWHAIRQCGLHLPSATGVDALIRQLYWRDFSSYLLFHFPTMVDQPLRPEYAHFPWSDDQSRLRAWQQGRTGYPIVDAGMRQLWATGWMHNRVRMIVASFLVKHLLVPWQRGADWFLDTLVDADLANNSASWQWVAGCGTDAAPYFRIFNPILQGKKFDPDGVYVRRWVPELATIPVRFVHEPWQADQQTLASSGLELGDNYPVPIVDHGEARKEALAAYQTTRSAAASDEALAN